LFILCVFLLNLRYFLCYHLMMNKVVYITWKLVSRSWRNCHVG